MVLNEYSTLFPASLEVVREKPRNPSTVSDALVNGKPLCAVKLYKGRWHTVIRGEIKATRFTVASDPVVVSESLSFQYPKHFVQMEY